MNQALMVKNVALHQVDSIDRYVAEINRYPLLNREQEQKLAYRLRKTGDVDAAHQLVTSNLRFVVKIAHEYKGYGLRLLDLIQEGNIGLMIAVKKFDPKRGYRLISYAVWWIRAYIQNFVLRSWSLVKLGTTQAQRKLFYKLRGTQAALERLEQNKEPLDHDRQNEEIAKALGVDTQEVTDMETRLATRDFSLNTEISSDSKQEHLDKLADTTMNQEELVGRHETQTQLADKVKIALTTLNPKERYIVEHRLMADEPLTLREIGEKFKISRERARQIESVVIKKVKKLLGPSIVEGLT